MPSNVGYTHGPSAVQMGSSELEVNVRRIDMKRHQLEMGDVRSRLWQLNLGVIATLLLGFAAACGAPTPAPTPTAAPTPTPAPTATPTPTPALITVGLGDDPQAFLQAIPASERDCVLQAFGTENLLEVIGKEPPSSEDMAKFTGCLSEETSRRMMLGTMMLEFGITEQDITCIGAGLRNVSFLDLVGGGEQERPGEQSARTFIYQIFRGAFNCLSEEDAAEMFGGVEEGGGPSLEQFQCLFASADDETIAKLFAMGARAGEGAPLPPELLDLITSCGPIPGPGGGGPPELTPEQQNCVTEAIGETALSQLFTGQRPPTLEESQKIEACGVSGPG